MTKKNYISIVLFLSLFTIGFVYLNKVFVSSHIFINSSKGFKKLAKQTNIDVLFYGSSHAYMDYNSLMIDKTCKTICYNLGSDAQRLPVTSYIIEESIKYTKPKLIVVEIYPASIKYPKTKKSKGFQLRAFDFISSFSKTKMNATINIYNKNEYLGVYFPLIRNHKKWNETNLNLSKKLIIDPNEYIFYDGYLGGYQKVSDKYRKKYPDFKNVKLKRTPNKHGISLEQKKQLTKLINIAKNNNIEILLISSPDFRVRFNNYNFYDELGEFCKLLNITYLNLNDFYNDTGINYDDFLDVYHLNIRGGLKVTKFLGEYINKNFKLPDRSEDIIWKEKKRKLNELINQKNIIKIFEKTGNFKFTKNFIFKKISIKKSRYQYTSEITLDSLNLNEKKLKEYKLAIHIYPIKTELNLINKFSKSQGRKFDLFDIYINKHFKDSTISFDFKTKINNIKFIELFLYKPGKGITGNAIKINKIEFR